MSTTIVLGPTPLPGALQGRLSLVFASAGALPRLMVSCVEGSWVGDYADLGGFDRLSERLPDWEIYVCARPHNRPVASAIFASGLFDLTGRCSGEGRSDAYIWRLRPGLLEPQVRADVARAAGWRYAPAASCMPPVMRASSRPGWGVAQPLVAMSPALSEGAGLDDDLGEGDAFAGLPRSRISTV